MTPDTSKATATLRRFMFRYFAIFVMWIGSMVFNNVEANLGRSIQAEQIWLIGCLLILGIVSYD